MSAGDLTKIDFQGSPKSVRSTEYAGIMSSGKGYYIFDQKSQEWKICSADRLHALSAKYGSLQVLSDSYEAGRRKSSPAGDTKSKPTQGGTIGDESTKGSTGLWIDPEFRTSTYDGATLFDESGLFA